MCIIRFVCTVVLCAFLMEVADPSTSFIRVYSPTDTSHHSSIPSVGLSESTPMVHAGEVAVSHGDTLGLPDQSRRVPFLCSQYTSTRLAFRIFSREDIPEHPPKYLLT